MARPSRPLRGVFTPPGNALFVVLQTIFAALVLLGLAAVALMVWAQHRQLALKAPATPAHLPAVSILKPVKGLDAGLAANLRSVFAQAYPRFEVVIGAHDADDPALAVTRRVAAEFPDVPCRIVADAREVGSNAKVNNLANLHRHARHELILISDSNVRLVPGTLADMVAHVLQPGVGLVSAPIRGVAGSGLGGRLDALQLNTFVMGGVSAMRQLFSGVCVVGKSMLLRREVLDRLGGFRFLSRFLAEDQVCGQEVARMGLGVVVSGTPVDNVVGPETVRQFAARHLRWARIRRRISPAGYVGELLLNPIALATVGALAERSLSGLALLVAAWLAKTILDAAADRRTGSRLYLLSYPLLVAAKDLLLGALWVVPWMSGTVAWRGNRYRLGARTLLIPVGQPAPEQIPLPAGHTSVRAA
jgi:ceramide glucosyltransferase